MKPLASDFSRVQRLDSYARNCLGFRISTPPKRCKTSKSLSPVMMQSQLPATAVEMISSSSRSRHTDADSLIGSTTSILDNNKLVASATSSQVNLNFSASRSRNSLRMKSEITRTWRRAQCSNTSAQSPRAMKAAMRTLVSRTSLTRLDRTRPRRCGRPALAPWRSYALAAA